MKTSLQSSYYLSCRPLKARCSVFHSRL